MDNLKIAIVTLYNPFEKIRGGIESVVYNLSISLARAGIETWILTMGNVEKETIKNQAGVNLWIIPDRGYRGLLVRSLIFIKEGRRAIKKMNELYNITIFNGQAGFSSPLVFANIKNGKIILTVHTIDGENFADVKDYWRLKKYRQLFTEIFKYPMLKIWRLFYFFNSDAFIFVSKFVKDEFRRFYPFMDDGKGIIIENGSPNINLETQIITKKEYGFIYAGRIDRRKGVDLIIKAASLLKKDGLKFNIVIVGDGLWKQDCEELAKRLKIEETVVFTGHLINYDNLLTFISKSKFFIFPSFYESDGLVIRESFQLGVPVIASNIPSSTDKVIHGENGYIFKNGDYLNLYNMMKQVLTIDENLYSKLSDNTKKRLEKQTWDDVAKKYVELFGRVNSNA